MKRIIISALLVLALAVSASAATVVYNISDGNVAGTYQVTATMDDDEGDYKSFANTLTFDSNIIVPVSKTTGNAANIAGGTVKSPLLQYSYTYYDEDEEMDMTISANIKTVTWTAGENGYYTLVFESYSDAQNLPLDGYQVFSMHFKYADGKSADDLTSDSFKVNSITYADGGYNYYGRDDEGKATNISVVNNVVPEPTVITIPVLAGDIVYLQDGTSSVIAADNDAYVVPSTVGYVAVNTGYDAQKTYYIDGKFAEEVHNGAIISTDEKQLRGPDEKSSEAEDTSGLRFLMNHNSETRKKIGHEVTKIGVLMTVESDKVKASLGEGFDFDHLKFEQADNKETMAYVKRGYAYHAEDGIDKVFGKEDQAWVISAVMYNITINAKNVKTTVVCRPFYEVDGTVIYGETMKCSLYEAADAISKTEAYESLSEEKKTYVQSILNAAGDTLIEENDIVIDISGLYTPKSN